MSTQQPQRMDTIKVVDVMERLAAYVEEDGKSFRIEALVTDIIVLAQQGERTRDQLVEIIDRCWPHVHIIPESLC